MWKALELILSLFSLYCCCAEPCRKSFSAFNMVKPTATSEDQAEAVRDLIARLVPEVSEKFIIRVLPFDFKDYMYAHGRSAHVSDTAQIYSAQDKIVITGTTGVAAAYGFHHYLKYYCKVHVSWNGDQLNIPNPLPAVVKAVVLRTAQRFRYYQNVCTPSYSFVWWDWTRWEREIDWMALNGINLPLAFSGQEGIWWRLYHDLGLTDPEILSHFSGAAFLAWQRMGNMEGWGGPLSKSWAANQLNLQHQILKRMRSFGMIPVLPGFAGHVPRALQRIFPNSSFSTFAPWGDFSKPFCCTLFLDPRDPTYGKIAKLFIEHQENEYNGTDHVYSIDLFNEMAPPSVQPSYLAEVSAHVWKSLVTVDPSAVWLIQSWFFLASYWKPESIKAFLSGVPIGKLLVLDLFAEKIPLWNTTSNFYGHYFIWCLLNNFGGNYGLIGSLESVTSGPIKALQAQESTLSGLGITPEGIGRNYILIDLLFEMAWRTSVVNISRWTADYAIRRSGSTSEFAVSAYQLLAGGVYDCKKTAIQRNTGLLVRRPSLDLSSVAWYDTANVAQAWGDLLKVAPDSKDVASYKYDLIDIGRQVLEDVSFVIYEHLRSAYQSKSISQIKTNGILFLQLIRDLDTLLACDEKFLLGKWLADAKRNANTSTERLLLEFNARNQITLWGPSGNILDYASKEWAGLMDSYYLPRWSLFLSYLLDSISTGLPFDQQRFNEETLKDGIAWTHGTESYPVKGQGDVIKISNALYAKYKHYLSH